MSNTDRKALPKDEQAEKIGRSECKYPEGDAEATLLGICHPWPGSRPFARTAQRWDGWGRSRLAYRESKGPNIVQEAAVRISLLEHPRSRWTVVSLSGFHPGARGMR